MTRPPTPDSSHPYQRTGRRLSLLDITPHQSAPLDRSSLTEPIHRLITGWPVRRESTDSAGISLNSDEDDGLTPTSRSRRRAGTGKADGKGFRGMDILAEGAGQAMQEERKERRSTSADDMLKEDAGSVGVANGAQGPKYICEFCAKTFSRPSSLRIHVYSRKSSFLIPCPADCAP
jgi:hypothetical protein